MEALVLPGLFLSILTFIAYVVIAWLNKPNGRALGRFARDPRRDSRGSR